MSSESDPQQEPREFHKKLVARTLLGGHTYKEILIMANNDPIPEGERPILIAYVQKLKDDHESVQA